jgi:RNA polymerase subunit RPABC4/transcription elongation factor Spt4
MEGGGQDQQHCATCGKPLGPDDYQCPFCGATDDDDTTIYDIL